MVQKLLKKYEFSMEKWLKKKWRKKPWCTIVGCNAQVLRLVLKQWQCSSASSIQVECLSAPSYIDCPLQKKNCCLSTGADRLVLLGYFKACLIFS